MKVSIYGLIKELFSLLTGEQKKRFFLLQVMVILMVFSEIAGVAAFGPFMALIGDISVLQGEGKLAELYMMTGLTNPYDFVFWVGIFVLAILIIATLISMFTVWHLSMFSAKVGMEISQQLYKYYMYQSWLFHSSTNSSHLTKQVAQESGRVSIQIISPILQLNAKLTLIIFLAAAVFIYNPVVATTGVFIITIAYFFLYKSVKSQLSKNGITLSQGTTERYKLMSEGFGGIKDALLLGRQKYFTSRFEDVGKDLSYSQGANRAIAQIPRYFMELVALGTIIFLVLYLIEAYDGNLGAILPLLAVYALAGYKLLPAAQQVYASIATIKGGVAAFESIKYDLKDSQSKKVNEFNNLRFDDEHINLKKDIKLNNISFTYPGKKSPALTDLNMRIPANKVIGLVGASGSGKTTAVDILLGLIQPQTGNLLIDDKPLNDENKRAWQNTIGFVPQDIFLSDGTIAENIAFGLAKEDINFRQVEHSIKLAHLDEHVNQLPDGINTRIGEHGIQLSGGQRQRIGIARSLYHDADVLILDEATSALDGITEKLIMDAIHDFSGSKTIVMIAHRLKTVMRCDIIFLFDQGKVIDHGTYDDLKERNEMFEKMTLHA